MLKKRDEFLPEIQKPITMTLDEIKQDMNNYAKRLARSSPMMKTRMCNKNRINLLDIRETVSFNLRNRRRISHSTT